MPVRRAGPALGTVAMLLAGALGGACTTTPPVTVPSSTMVTVAPTTTSMVAPGITEPTTVATTPGPATSFGTQQAPCTFSLVAGQVALPDARCTPGAVDPAITQATIGQTICASGYTSTVRPPESVTSPEKRASMAAYGAPGSTALYEYDHLVSLEVGGAPNAAANLWPEPYAGPYGARVKDRLENRLHSMICAGAISLVDAQRQEAGDWVAAYRRFVGPLP